MKRAKGISKAEIIKTAKMLESGETVFKLGDGIAALLIEARYIIEHGMSSDEYREKSYNESNEFMARLVSTTV